MVQGPGSPFLGASGVPNKAVDFLLLPFPDLLGSEAVAPSPQYRVGQIEGAQTSGGLPANFYLLEPAALTQRPSSLRVPALTFLSPLGLYEVSCP